MTDYFDRVEGQLSALNASGAGRGRLRPLVPVLVSALVVLAIGAGLLVTRAGPDRAGGGRPVAKPLQPIQIGRPDPGLVVPATYGAACQQAGNPCDPGAPVPVALHREMSLYLLRVGRQCRATHGASIKTALIGGIALGGAGDTVRPLIANAGRLRRGIVRLGSTELPGWKAIKIIWFSVPHYSGPFVIRAQSLRHSGPVRIGTAGGLPPDAPLVVAPGPTINTGLDGYRALPSALWVRRPGCYGVQVDGLNFTDTFVIKAVRR